VSEPEQPLSDEEISELLRPSRDEMLERIPLDVEVAEGVDLEAEDPAWVEGWGRRCIAVRRAGGRCATRPQLDGLLCRPHAGVMDPSVGGRALARKRRESRVSEEERARLARLGARGAIAEALAKRATDLQRVVDVLVDAAVLGDLSSAKLLGPYLNQGLGLPTERVEATLTASGEGEIEALPTADLIALVRSQPSTDAA